MSHTFVNTAAVLPILFRGYRGETVADVLGVKLGDSVSPAADRFVQVVYLPSFDPEVTLSLALDGDRTTLSVASANISLWGAACLAWDPDRARGPAGECLPDTITIHQEQIVVPAAEAGEIWSRIGAISVNEASRGDIAVDGMNVEGSLRDGRKYDFKSHVAFGGPGVELAKLLVDVASERARLPASQTTLENLFGYFAGSGLPVKVQPGPPRILRFFGRLGWDDHTADALRALLSAVPADEPLIVDFSNFRSMGALFYPLFRPLVQRSGSSAWIRSSAADPCFVAMSVQPASIFDTMSEALSHLRRTKR